MVVWDTKDVGSVVDWGVKYKQLKCKIPFIS
jgi:hypothetical protein